MSEVNLRTHNIRGEPLNETALKVAKHADDMVEEIVKAFPHLKPQELLWYAISSAGAAVSMRTGGLEVDDMVSALLMKVEEIVRSLPREKQDGARASFIEIFEELAERDIATTGVFTLDKAKIS